MATTAYRQSTVNSIAQAAAGTMELSNMLYRLAGLLAATVIPTLVWTVAFVFGAEALGMPVGEDTIAKFSVGVSALSLVCASIAMRS